MCAFHDQGFGKGFEEEQTAVLRAQGVDWLVGTRLPRTAPRGPLLRACGPIVTRQVTATRVSSLKLLSQKSSSEDPRVKGPTLSGG